MGIQAPIIPIKSLGQKKGCEKGIDVQWYVNDHPYINNSYPEKNVLKLRPKDINGVQLIQAENYHDY